MSFDRELHEEFGLSQSDPDAIDKIVDMVSKGNAPKNTKRPQTFGEVEEMLKQTPQEDE
jgi:hypothetical protein